MPYHAHLTRFGDWNDKSRELLQETQKLGGNPYRQKYLDAIAETGIPTGRVKVRCECGPSAQGRQNYLGDL